VSQIRGGDIATNETEHDAMARLWVPALEDQATDATEHADHVALHGRYPHHLETLKDKWWTDDSQTETLCALAMWRAEIDDTGQDPREELAFQNQLADYAQVLRQQGGGVTKAWKPGAPPPEWAPK
jgi:hypothetical protein